MTQEKKEKKVKVVISDVKPLKQIIESDKLDIEKLIAFRTSCVEEYDLSEDQISALTQATIQQLTKILSDKTPVRIKEKILVDHSFLNYLVIAALKSKKLSEAYIKDTILKRTQNYDVVFEVINGKHIKTIDELFKLTKFLHKNKHKYPPEQFQLLWETLAVRFTTSKSTIE